MATTTIYWGDGTTDKITVEYTGSGNGKITVSSDPNLSKSVRTKTLTVKTTDGAVVRTIIVTQKSRVRAYSGAYGSRYK